MLQDLTGFATDQVAISLCEIPSSNAMEMGQIMPALGLHEGYLKRLTVDSSLSQSRPIL